MVASKQATVSERRALLTDREREIIAGDADVADSYRYQTISRVRARFDRLESDLQALERHGELADEFRGIVCRADADQTPPASARESATESGEESAAAGSPPQPPGDGERRSERAHGDERAGGGGRALESAIAALDTTDERRDAVRACVDHLREHGTAQRKDFLAALYPEHTAGFGSDGGWWNTIGKEHLSDVAERVNVVKAPPKEGSHTWRYRPAVDDGEGEGDT
jgi:hypothetical protein